MKRDIVRARYRHNPIFTRAEIPYPVETVHNAAVVKHGNEYIMLFRSHLRTGRSIIGLARSVDGFRFIADPEPFLRPERDSPFAAYEEFSVEDPRVTRVDGEYLITYSAYSRNGVRIALAKTKDFAQIERVSLITQADSRNAVIFPERFERLYARLDRPHSEIAPWSNLDLLFSGLAFLGRVPTRHETGTLSLGRNEDWSGSAADQDRAGLAFHIPWRVQNYGWIYLSFGSRSSRPAESGENRRGERLLDSSAGRA